MKRILANFFLKYLLNAVVPSDVIKIDKKGVIKIDGKPITDQELRQLQAEVKALEGFRLWGILTNSLEYIAHDKIFNRVLTVGDIMAGKMLLFGTDTQKEICRIIKSKQ